MEVHILVPAFMQWMSLTDVSCPLPSLAAEAAAAVTATQAETARVASLDLEEQELESLAPPSSRPGSRMDSPRVGPPLTAGPSAARGASAPQRCVGTLTG